VNTSDLLARVRLLVPGLTEHAAALDDTGRFPADDIAALAEAGVLLAPLPQSAGGLGLGTEPAGAAGVLALLRLLGQGHLSVGRVFEAHVNAIRLIARYGSARQVAAAAQDVAAGCLFALWVTDPPGGALAIGADHLLHGRKQFCSAAGFARRAVVTAVDGAGVTRLAVAALGRGVTVTPLASGMQGMRAATTGQVAFDGVPADPFGAPGDYLREPDLSAGAWRTSAVTLGGLDALVAEAIVQLKGRGRTDDPHQQARIGQALIAAETARLWLAAAAARAEAAAPLDGASTADTVAYVNFARLAVERACLEAMALVQRCLGVAAFLRPNPVERLCRDLATYLRQPAPDMVLTEAAAHVIAKPQIGA
jgi:alkylation response protein AidB-like acyl-CoA dehydrogenase